MEQLNLFGHVAAAFANAPADGIATAQLYDAVATAAGSIWPRRMPKSLLVRPAPCTAPSSAPCDGTSRH